LHEVQEDLERPLHEVQEDLEDEDLEARGFYNRQVLY
jgi:hypothetical protein